MQTSAFSPQEKLVDGAAVSAANVNLTNCDREQIHIPGSVQPHGVLLVIEEAARTIVQVSANTKQVLDVEPAELLNQPLAKFMEATDFRYWEQQLMLKRLDENPLYLMPLRWNGSDRMFEGALHRHEGVLMIQLEGYEPVESTRTLGMYSSARSLLTELQRTETLAEFYAKAADYVRDHTGYDRVVVYRFLENESGEVVGESRREDMPPWLGLRYPASDIPRQARELYLKNWIRIIADVDAVPAGMIPLLNPTNGKPLDMSLCAIRSVSPIHVQYLQNIGTRASMSLSIINNDKLWGLIACHHSAPKCVSHAARIASEFLAHSVSLQVRGKEDSEHHLYFRRLREKASEIAEELGADSRNQQGRLLQKMLECFRAKGTGFVTNESVELLGETPGREQISEMLPWLSCQALRDGVYATEKLAAVYAPAVEFAAQASGLLAVRIDHEPLKWLLWFRPEMAQLIKWAGDPNKPVEIDPKTGELRLSPRTSFALWKEESRDTSEPWWNAELEIAADLRRALLDIVLRHMTDLRQMNEDLQRSNAELEAFAYVASHDLKEPIRGIYNYSNILLRTLKDKLEPIESERFQMIFRLSQRMENLLDSLMQYARVGNTELETQAVDIQTVVLQVVAMLKPKLEESNTEIRIVGELPSAVGDQIRIQEIFENLISNAVKYNDKSERWVEVGCSEGSPATFYVRDNGIGIDTRHHETIFTIFKRLHTADKFGGGTGAGLTITKKLVERHKGRLWLESEKGKGSTFYFTLGEKP